MSARRDLDKHTPRRSHRPVAPTLLLALAAAVCSGGSPAAATGAAARDSGTAASVMPQATMRLSNEAFLAQVGAESQAADDFGRRHLPLQFSGRLDQAVAELVAYAERGGAARRFAIGNMLWAMAPDASLGLHRSADALQPEQPEILFELALHYTRKDDCAAALPLWARLRAGPIGIPATATYVAAYCHLVRGDLRGAVAIVRDSDVDSHHVGAEKMSYEVFGGPSELSLFDRDYRQAAGGDRAALERLLARSFDWHGDWWNAAPQASAQDAAIALARTQWSPRQRERQEWDCLWPKLRDGAQAFGYDDLERCRVIVGGHPSSAHPYPASSALGWVALGRAVARAAQPPDFAALLARHGDTLRERAVGVAGDLQALRVLAYLQQGAGDAAGLAASDELGWKRYREEAFARSRIERARPAADAAPDPAYRALLAQAAQDFPHDPLYPLLQASDGGGDPSAADLARILQAETRTLDLSVRSGGLRSHSQLKALYRLLDTALEKAGARPGG
ncbi:hypothetical protein [Lysobacter enzymogenes]|uniref:Uncharacterized protein n=1 Tax=Lysobacter enzymogenes TaxID=69 RepID=A0A3N2RLN8_LYSEN|nr:hypothetical protein [Lysobacter enzymogenes]ROU08291.1 hypothetical protein D9T17_05095 [Lysobacter enzymogenes]